jgi:hypothetical protein
MERAPERVQVPEPELVAAGRHRNARNQEKQPKENFPNEKSTFDHRNDGHYGSAFGTGFGAGHPEPRVPAVARTVADHGPGDARDRDDSDTSDASDAWNGQHQYRLLDGNDKRFPERDIVEYDRRRIL